MNAKPFRVLRLDDVESIPGPGSLMWKPIRFELGIRAFGCNAYSADEAGHDVVEPHTEEGGSEHEELYFVARGAATFKIDDETFEAEAGTYVFVPDPGSRREAIAKEAGTVVLSFGGPSDFTPSAWEWSWRASPESAAILYQLACLEAHEGHDGDALVALREAVDLDADVANWAKTDDDLRSLRELPDFKAIVAG